MRPKGLRRLDARLHPARAHLQAERFGQRTEVGVLAPQQLAGVAREQLDFQPDEFRDVHEKFRRKSAHVHRVHPPQGGRDFEHGRFRLVATRGAEPRRRFRQGGRHTVVRVVIFGRMSQHERWFETAINLHQLRSLRSIIGQLPIRMAAEKEFRAQHVRRSAHFLATHRRQPPYRLARLSFVTLTQNTHCKGGTACFGASQRAGAEQFGVIGMRDDCEHALVFEAEFHFRAIATECSAVLPRNPRW